MIYYAKSAAGFFDESLCGTFGAPDSLIPADAVEITEQEHAQLLIDQSQGKVIVADADGRPVAQLPQLTQQQHFDAISAELQKALEQGAKDRRYDSLLSACSYAAQPAGAPFQAEGAAFIAWRSAVWAKAAATEADVIAGTAQMPTIAQALAEMPALVLPA